MLDQLPILFLESYELPSESEPLGQGHIGSVYACRHRLTGDMFAVKCCLVRDSETRENVMKEVDILYLCRFHPNILRMIEHFEDLERRIILIVMEKCTTSLYEWIKQSPVFTERMAASVTADLASALAFLHANGRAHRDLKPQNVLCDGDPGLGIPKVKLCDFDLGSKDTGMSTPQLKTPCGTADFMAPELIMAYWDPNQRYSKQCDMWSLGVILYTILSGQPPFVGNCEKGCRFLGSESCGQCSEDLLDAIAEGEYEFDDEHWECVSEEAVSLVEALLTVEVDQRLTAEQVLQHPWVTGALHVPATPLRTPKEFRAGLTSAMFMSPRHAHSLYSPAGPDMLLDSEPDPHWAFAQPPRRQKTDAPPSTHSSANTDTHPTSAATTTSGCRARGLDACAPSHPVDASATLPRASSLTAALLVRETELASGAASSALTASLRSHSDPVASTLAHAPAAHACDAANQSVDTATGTSASNDSVSATSAPIPIRPAMDATRPGLAGSLSSSLGTSGSGRSPVISSSPLGATILQRRRASGSSRGGSPAVT